MQDVFGLVEIYRDTYKIAKRLGNPLYEIIQKIDMTVSDCADRAYNLSALDSSNPKHNLWLQAAGEYLASHTYDFKIYTSYGSAVEEMVNQYIRANYQAPVNGYSVYLQVRHGNTIPDIVIVDRSGNEAAWLDITSSGTAGHIWDKDGSGWKTTDFVAELLYNPLDFSKIRHSDGPGIGPMACTLSFSRKASIHQRHLKEHLYNGIIASLELIYQTDSVTKSKIADCMQQAFKVKFSFVKHPAIKSLLKQFIETNYAGPYVELVREILRSYYKNDRQDLISAMKFLSESYSLKQLEEDSVFEYYF